MSYKFGSGKTGNGLGLDNIILLSDSYKVSHHVQYPPNTTKIYSYFESRGGLHDEICFFGLQYFIKRYLAGVVVTNEKIAEAKTMFEAHFGPGTNVFNESGWQYIVDHHGGKLPVTIKALPEGTVVPVKTCCMTVENTDPKCFWLVNFLETLLVQVWYPMTVATNSREQKKVLTYFLNQTGEPAEVNFKLHDFGFRGVSSVESAGIGDAGHLTQFLGTDTVAGLVVARDYYGCPCAGFSIPASEHSTMTSWGRDSSSPNNAGGEIAAMRNMLAKYPTGLVACVSDSYDIWSACSDKWGRELKAEVLARKGCLVVRPDSGPPCLMDLAMLQKLGAPEAFGCSDNKKGYKVLPDQVRTIQGDGIDFESLTLICALLADQKWSISNIAFGSGGGLIQKLNRDTQKCAFKCSMAMVDGKEISVYKNPVHAPGKVSKKGRMTVNKVNGKIVTLCGDDRDEKTDILVNVFQDGALTREFSFDEIRAASNVSVDNIDEWGPAVSTRATNLLATYKQSKQYLKDVAVMKIGESNYSPPYPEPMASN